jgi:general secretion pathway protein G
MLTKNRRRRAQRGMTLIEIMVVMVLLAMLMGLVGVALIPRIEEGKRKTARTQIGNFQTAMQCYYVKKGRFPSTAEGLKALVDTQCMESLPQDPWNTDYVYLEESGKPVIISYGKDQQQGGEGNDADISSKDPVQTE